MEPGAYERPLQSSPAGGNSSSFSRDINAATDKAASAIHDASRQIGDSAAETINQARKKAGEVYNEVNRTVNDQYNRAVDYSRQNPGTTTLIAFGVGVGVGALLLRNVSGSRGRRQRVVQPVVNALSTLAYELFG